MNRLTKAARTFKTRCMLSTRRLFCSQRFLIALGAVATIAAPSIADAQAQSQPASYAIVVGANRGGPGQKTLQFAERDATSMASVLQTIGRYPNANVTQLSQPSPTELRGAINRLAAKVKSHAARGEQTSVVFYYSGHSRANALNLGDNEVALSALRASLEEMPSTLTVVILDACQSGSFSNVKGITGAADFSVNSVASLNASGMAVMASSSATELSQESERLGASYFSHYLIVALRGAGDDNSDGRVTLSEAYRYAYNRTLAATAKTAVGKQHVTLETDLRGKGEIALSYPASVKSGVVIDRQTTGEFTFQARKSGAVLAEVYKASDRVVRLALGPGSYNVIVRKGDDLVECRQLVRANGPTPFQPTGCSPIVPEQTAAKGLHTSRPWSFEVGIGGGSGSGDAYTNRLGNFGFERRGEGGSFHNELALYHHLSHRMWVGFGLMTLNSEEFVRRGDTEQEDFSYISAALVASFRYQQPLLLSKNLNQAFIPFVELGAGVTRAKSTFQVGTEQPDEESDGGYLLSASFGAQMMFSRRFGLYGKARFAVAPTLDNLLGDTRDVGGWFISFGLRTTFDGGN